MRALLGNFKNLLACGCLSYRNYSAEREGRILRKILSRGQKNSNKKDYIPSATTLHQYARDTLRSPESRRTTVWNKIFMENVNELVTTGTYATEIFNHAINITQVKTTPNHHIIYVFWMQTKSTNESDIDDLLKKVATYIRFELTASRVVGQVPEIRFVKDQDYITIKETEDILDRIMHENEKLKKEKEKEINVENVTKLEPTFPLMEHNVFGLQHLHIMNRIKDSMRKSIKMPDKKEETEALVKNEVQAFNKKELARILLKKKYEIKKLRRLNKETALTMQTEDESAHFDDTLEEYEEWERDCKGNEEK